MGDIGARLLAKALQINNKLRSISLDRNNITLQGNSNSSNRKLEKSFSCFLAVQKVCAYSLMHPDVFHSTN